MSSCYNAAIFCVSDSGLAGGDATGVLSPSGSQGSVQRLPQGHADYEHAIGTDDTEISTHL